MQFPVLNFNRVKNFSDEDWNKFHIYMHKLPIIVQMIALHDSGDDQPPPRPADDVVIDCALCANDQWWKDNFGAFWQAAQWLACGPLGLGCGAGSGG